MNADRALLWTTRVVLGLVVIALLIALYGLAGCDSVRQGAHRVWEPLTENGFRLLLSIFVGFALWLFIPAGEVGKVLAALFGVYVTQAATSQVDPQVVVQPGSMLPWYLDPMAYVWLIVKWLAVAVVVGLCFRRSRDQTFQFIKDTVSGHPRIGLRRFAAGMGWLHSDPIPDKEMKAK